MWTQSTLKVQKQILSYDFTEALTIQALKVLKWAKVFFFIDKSMIMNSPPSWCIKSPRQALKGDRFLLLSGCVQALDDMTSLGLIQRRGMWYTATLITATVLLSETPCSKQKNCLDLNKITLYYCQTIIDGVWSRLNVSRGHDAILIRSANEDYFSSHHLNCFLVSTKLPAIITRQYEFNSYWHVLILR